MANFTRDGYGQVEPNQLSGQKTGQIYASLPLDPEVNVLQNGEFMFYDQANGTVNAGKAASQQAGTVATQGEPMLVFNEIKLYEPFWRTSYKDFAMIRVGDNYITSSYNTATSIANAELPTAGIGGGADNAGATISPAHTEYGYRMDGFAPRLIKTNVGDIYTTNMVKTGVEYALGDVLVLVKNSTSKTLVLEKEDTSQGSTQVAVGSLKFMVVKAPKTTTGGTWTMPDGQPAVKLQRIV